MAEEAKKPGLVVRVAEKIEAGLDKVDFNDLARKTVVVPIKWLAIGAFAVVVLAIALSLSKRVEPYASHLLGDPEVVVKKAK